MKVVVEVVMVDYEQVFKALGDRSRLRILNLFLSAEEALCGCELMEALQLPQYQISRHVSVLRHAGLVSGRKSGRWVYYGLRRNPAELQELWEALRRGLSKDPRMAREAARIRARLQLREGGRCVVGSVPAGELERRVRTFADPSGRR